MKIKIEIDTSNAAFDDYGSQEVARILTTLAHDLFPMSWQVCEKRILRDINGNTVGSFETVDE